MKRLFLTAACVLVTLCGCDSPPANDKAPGGWSRTRIESDPLGYIDWSLAELDRLEARLKNHCVNAEITNVNLSREKTAGQALLASRESQLRQLVELYKQHDSRKEWPASCGGVDVDEATLKRIILETGTAIETAKTGATGSQPVGGRKQERVQDLNDAISKIQTQRKRLITARRTLQLGADISSLNDLVGNTNEIVASSGHTLDSTQSPSSGSTGRAASTNDPDKSFNAIIKRYQQDETN